jgi:GT2 family glycosyltransferase
MAVSVRSFRGPSSDREAKAFVEGVLDELEVTERAFHHLNYSLPLVVDLVRRSQCSAEPADRVLLIGGNTLLAECLLRLDFALEIWQFPQAYLTDEMQRLVTRSVSPAELDELEVGEERYQLIIVPLVLESLVGGAEQFLSKLRELLQPEGRLLIATANQLRLETRLAALSGRQIKPRAEASAVSLSWPSLASIREYHSRELAKIARSAGLTVRKSDFVAAERPFLEMEPLNVIDYSRRKLRGLVGDVLPSWRNVFVLELGTRIGAGVPVRTARQEPIVSVFVSVHNGGEMLRDTLKALLHQTYRSDLLEIVVLHDGSRPDVDAAVSEATAENVCAVRALVLSQADGPEARNLAMAGSDSDISAHTDDACFLPDDWVQAAVSWFDEDTVAVTGPVFLKEGSGGRHMAVPGTRPDPDEKGVCPRNLFPISNVFYRTQIAIAAGGFDRRFMRGDYAAFGWNTELAWRLNRSGWRIRFCDEAYEFRLFSPDTARLTWVNREMQRASELPALLKATPEYGDGTLVASLFASKQTMYFDWALAGLVMAVSRRQWPWLLAGIPWLALISHHVDVWPPTRWKSSVLSFGKIAAKQAVWLAGFVHGSIKAKQVVL